MKIEIDMAADDFDRLWTTASERPIGWLDVCDLIDADEPALRDWRWAYVVSHAYGNWASVMMMRTFLRQQGHDCCIAWNADNRWWMVFTDFATTELALDGTAAR